MPENDLSSIPFALDYIKVCIPANYAENDSIFHLFNEKFSSITNRFNSSTEFKFVTEQLEKDSGAKELIAIKDNLAFCGLKIASNEGEYCAEEQADYFYNNFNSLVSEGVKTYLNCRKDELKKVYAQDACLMISFEELYQRVVRWEEFLNKFPNTRYKNEAKDYYTLYLKILLTGMDNSEIFDSGNHILLPKIKQLYQRIITNKSESPSKRIISDYYALLSRHSFQANDSIAIFLEKND